MRTLCINLGRTEDFSVAENFLRLSPLVQFQRPGFIFVDITGTSHLFGGELQLLNEALRLTKGSHPDATMAISDTPAPAQVLTSLRPSFPIVPPGQERDFLLNLPVEALIHLEGLIPWESADAIQSIVSFFQTLGLKVIRELDKLRIESLRERWGRMGEMLWKKIHAAEKQIISPLIPSETLREFVHFDWPISLLSPLLHSLGILLERLCQRLQGRAECARLISIHLYCEYSQRTHFIELRPVQPSRDLELILKLLENKLASTDLENPIQDMEINILPCPEKILQLDFFSPRTYEQDKIDQLLSLFNQCSLKAGFFNLSHSLVPENSWSLSPDFIEFTTLTDHIDTKEESYRVKPAYSRHLPSSPRPTRLLRVPEKLSSLKVKQLRFLSSFPIERIEDKWWAELQKRDYFFALSPLKQGLWLYRDLIRNEYYIHGYFD